MAADARGSDAESARVPLRVSVLIVSYNQPELLRDCLGSLLESVPNPELIEMRMHVVDNASSVGDMDVDVLRREFPAVEFRRLPDNLGFAGGNNSGWEWIEASNDSPHFLMLLNPDTLVERGWLEPLVERLEQTPQVAAVQPLLVLHPETERINTLGNDCHYLGFGLMRGYRQPVTSAPTGPVEIASASGAAVLLRASVIREVGLFDPRYFLYLEDTELGWKLRLAGHAVELVPQSRVFHRFTFQAPYRRYGYLERNRWWLLLAYYRWRTLLLLSPMLLLMECGQWLFALKNGLMRQRSWAMFELLRPVNWGPQWAARRRARRLRRISDRELTRTFSATFDAALLPGFLVQRIANPVLSSYWRLARSLMWW